MVDLFESYGAIKDSHLMFTSVWLTELTVAPGVIDVYEFCFVMVTEELHLNIKTKILVTLFVNKGISAVCGIWNLREAVVMWTF